MSFGAGPWAVNGRLLNLYPRPVMLGCPFWAMPSAASLVTCSSPGVVVASLGWVRQCSVGRVSGDCLAFAAGFVLVHGTACVFHSSIDGPHVPRARGRIHRWFLCCIPFGWYWCASINLSARLLSLCCRVDVPVVPVLHAYTAVAAVAMAHGCLRVLSDSEHLFGHERYLSLPFHLSLASIGRPQATRDCSCSGARPVVGGRRL